MKSLMEMAAAMRQMQEAPGGENPFTALGQVAALLQSINNELHILNDNFAALVGKKEN